jgi:hypothetical protein
MGKKKWRIIGVMETASPPLWSQQWYLRYNLAGVHSHKRLEVDVAKIIN